MNGLLVTLASSEQRRILIQSSVVFPLIIMVFVLPACSLIRIGPAVEILELNPDENADKNLDAVRAMQADRYRRAPMIVPDSPATSSHATPSSDEPQTFTVPSELPWRMMPATLSPMAPKTGALAKRPWSPPAASPPGTPERSVPAYTIPAPAAQGQTAFSRCVPDGMGGQRCLAY